MKRILSIVLCLCLLFPALALAEFDPAPLKSDPDIIVIPLPNSVDTVYRPVNQPYFGQVDEGFNGELVAYVEYITLVDADATVLRLMISTVSWDMPYNAEEICLTVGSTRYSLAVTHDESEYDGTYMEDYSACLVGNGLNLIKAIAQQKKDTPIRVELLSEGNVVFSGQVIIPGEEAAAIYDQWIDLGGKQQSLKPLEELWPCKVEKQK
ncbi:MAG: hypothetical protein IKL25_04015 [Clostridia bacterium]|nr:hypothetical protein [Clostridia bacterium]